MTVAFNHRRFLTQHGTPEGTVCGDVYFAHQILILMSKIQPEIVALFHDGISGYCEVESPAGLHFESGASDKPFSLGFWVKPTRIGRLHIMQYGTSDSEWEIFALRNRKWIMRLYQSDDVRIGVKSKEKFDDVGVWTYIVATYDGGGTSAGLRLYRDGRPLDTKNADKGTYSAMRTVADALLKIGKRKKKEATCSIGEIAIWGRELSAAEVRRIYGIGHPGDLKQLPGASDLVSWWRVTEADFPTLVDVMGNNDALAVNMTKQKVVKGRKR